MQLTNLEQGGSEQQRKRIRAAAACIPCREVRVKCRKADSSSSSSFFSRSEHCERCIELGLRCVFVPSLRSKGGKGDSVRELKTTVGQLRQELDEFRRQAAPSQGRPPHSTSIAPLDQVIDSYDLLDDTIDVQYSASVPSTHTEVHSRSDEAPHQGGEEGSSINPLNMLYKASMRTFLEEKNKDESSSSHTVAAALKPSVSIGIQVQTAEKQVHAKQGEPELIRQGIIDWSEAQQLYTTFFQYCNQHIFLLDPTYHTFAELIRRSHFLWTVVCYVASRYVEMKGREFSEAICEVALQMAKEVILTSDSVETVQGLLLLAAWYKRSKQAGDQIAWMLSGAAIRMAIGSRLSDGIAREKFNKKGSDDSIKSSLETLNRQRTWLLCYAADRSFCALTGNQPVMRENTLVGNCRSWCQQGHGQPWDAGISCYVELQKLQSRQFEQLSTMTSHTSSIRPGGLSDLVDMFHDQLNEWREEWTRILTACVEKASTSGTELHLLILENIGRQLPLRLGHARLVLNSFALSQIPRNEEAKEEIAKFVCNCWLAAKDVVYSVSLGSNMRYSPDNQFIMVAFACVTLLKLKQRAETQSSAFLDTKEIRKIVSQTATSLEALAIDRQHSPALFASFLRHLLEMDQSESPVTSDPRSTLNPADISTFPEDLLLDSTPITNDPSWLTDPNQLLFNNALYSAPSQACMGDEFWDSLLPNLSGPFVGNAAWLARNDGSGG